MKKIVSLRLFIRHYVKKLWNKQFLIFLFFLALSTAFWLFQALNETYEEEFRVPVELTGVPGNVVITTDLPKTMQVTLRDKGIMLLGYRYTHQLKPISIDFKAYANSSGSITVQSSEVIKQISSQLMPSTQLLMLKPESMTLYYNYGECKRVPVILLGRVRAARLYTLAGIRLSTDSVLVYAAREVLDTITAAYISPVDLRNLTDTTRVDATLARVKGAKFVPTTVGVTYCVDRLVEKTVLVPVQQVNFPASKQLRTFPSSVNITFQVGMGQYRNITSDNFVLVVNYEDLLKNNSTSCHLSLKTIPAGVSHVRITPQDVEYVIEDVPDSESENE